MESLALARKNPIYSQRPQVQNERKRFEVVETVPSSVDPSPQQGRSDQDAGTERARLASAEVKDSGPPSAYSTLGMDADEFEFDLVELANAVDSLGPVESVSPSVLASLESAGCREFADLLRNNQVELEPVPGMELLIIAPSDAAMGTVIQDLRNHENNAKCFIDAHIKFYRSGHSLIERGMMPSAGSIKMEHGTAHAIEPANATQLAAIQQIGGAAVTHRIDSVNSVKILCVDSTMKAMRLFTEFRLEQIMDKTPLPGPGVTVVGTGPEDAYIVEVRLFGAATREPIRVKPTPEDTEERKKFGYCRFGQVLADTNPELVDDEKVLRGSNQQTPRLRLQKGFVESGGRRVQWSKEGKNGTSFYLKILHCP